MSAYHILELLNCDAVRNDITTRMWAQTRLMETEKELRSGRRRRSPPRHGLAELDDQTKPVFAVRIPYTGSLCLT